ncbi:uncharacterized protein K452DRAFT_349691 [Aplosporella prunicola CBS 121167]|uniref:Translation machinery-associated protein 16 n=1 Tax=Aplosporella prunicola CBS 121167 TaxID=1176127 RepID=A0A6A6BKJ4_9PEZI|nr:uncharacterized protein K452DRAFT_349691 [Aplosporella prunicola CBS 121167]KAF2144640.1 hypothetical protein K452DRAFT_349691 [Aplosporella prunicola CBS 121167]
MPKSLSKVQKQIAKKRGSAGKASAMHENSRDHHRLQAAGVRDEKIARIIASRSKQNQPYLLRIAHFRGAAEALPLPLAPIPISDTVSLIQSYVFRDDEELSQLKKSRRAGRPPSVRENMLRQRREAEEKEFESGFYVPDMQDEMTLARLRNWDGDWVGCNAMKFVRISKAGEKKESIWPPKGMS